MANLTFAVRCVLLMSALAPPIAYSAGGWYLLLPPRSKYNESAVYLAGYKILETESLSKWSQDGAYDRAEDCETVRATNQLSEERFFSKNSADYSAALQAHKQPSTLEALRSGVEISNANVNVWGASRCIKSDDPRLLK